jgi:hypothetical protein
MSFARIATLRISDQSYDLMHFRYRFHRKTDWHGLPLGGMRGGDIVVTMESTKSTELLERFLNADPENPTDHPPRVVKGSIEVCDPEDGKVIRRLVFEEAFIYAVGESLNTCSPLPMMQTVAISPLRLDINRNVRMDRRFPQTYAFWWDRYKEPEPREVATVPQQEPIVYVTRVDGPAEGLPNETLTYKAIAYSSSPTDTDRQNVKWQIKVGDRTEPLTDRGETVEIKLKEEWAGEEILVMAYLHSPTEKVSQKTFCQDTRHYVVIPEKGRIKKDFSKPIEKTRYHINNRLSNELTVQKLLDEQPFGDFIVSRGIDQITSDYNSKYSVLGFPNDYYDFLGKYLSTLSIWKFSKATSVYPKYFVIGSALDEICKLIDSNNGFNNGLGAPLFHIYENVVRKDDNTGLDKLLHFMYSAKWAYTTSPGISKALGAMKEFVNDEIMSWLNDDKGWDDLDMDANEKGIEFGRKLAES